MKKNYIVSKIVIVFLVAIFLGACDVKPAKDAHSGHNEKQEYTCPMHPQIVSDKPGQCPICGMDLVTRASNKELNVDSSLKPLLQPVNAKVVTTIPFITPEKGMRIFSTQLNGIITYDTRNQVSVASRVSGRIERLLVKYNYQPVKKGDLIMEIYSPDLAAAQRELLFIANSRDGGDMLAKARQRLQLLGMQPAQVEQTLKTGKILYRVPVYSNSSGYILEKASSVSAPIPANASMSSSSTSASDGMGSMAAGTPVSAATPVSTVPAASPVLLREGQYVNAGQSLFTIYEKGNLVAEFAINADLTPHIKVGQQLLLRPMYNEDDFHEAAIGLIEPVLSSGQNFTRIRVYLRDNLFQAGQLVIGNLPVIYRNGWWVPRKALLKLGNRSIVFKKEGNLYVSREVDAGFATSDMVAVTSDIGNWEIASNAYYLVDSESFIKTDTIKRQQ